MIIIACGGRDFINRECVYGALDSIHSLTPITLLKHGRARGADTLAHRWAVWRKVPIKPYDAKWTVLTAPGAVIRTRADGTKYNAMAGFDRNQLMIDDPPEVKLCVAFPGGDGTDDMVRRALLAEIEVRRIWC